MQADRRWRVLPLVAVLMLVAGQACAGPTEDAVAEALKQDYSPALRNFVILTMLSLIPVLMIGMTAFTRIIIVLSLLRHALGIPQTPPNSVVITLAICMTYFTMSPVLDRMNHDAIAPYMSEQITAQQAIELGSRPLREFMVSQTRESDLRTVIEMAKAPAPKTMDDIRFGHLVTAFLLSELKTAFQIGFVIFLPFVLIDLVVAAALMALGMIMLPPTTISLPLKILLFVLIDGWVLLSKALLGSYWN
ncbi:flagellar type III secretion system pore protein FliP [Stenotrophomonas maltophilia]|uniref:Flagellar biosynthetic protein FliP n=1 Tax=Stenotrophomonas maltophilia TaxID=40324 RepID=A0A6B8J3A5_STEMA|nr:flagellar type III secretion system pore protein FliP [Stenotrophomonas maltophilia]MBH1652072.1 flagellar type III secretion system pore protein FliP [Stenotrophomonas maltophilia]QGM00297.1 flagellar type III secretion system pore protein FliP [Stenotrophomonas maltophilia]HDS1508839.1 flagellar type III secretion system pore protein FliP [Stenotrophomonas maltophilia]